MGLHRNWTSSSTSASAPETMRKKGRFRSASLFSGVAGIELGVQEAMEATIYVECDEAAQAVLRKRMEDKHIPRGIIYNKVQDLDSEKLENIEAITAGSHVPTSGKSVRSKDYRVSDRHSSGSSCEPWSTRVAKLSFSKMLLTSFRMR